MVCFELTHIRNSELLSQFIIKLRKIPGYVKKLVLPGNQIDNE